MEITKRQIHELKKVEIVWLSKHRCRHRHTYLEHLKCYFEEVSPTLEKIGFFDIEASNLDANFGIMLSYCIKELDGPILGNVITQDQLRSKHQDRKLVRKCIEDLQKFDRIVTFYGARYDMPFTRSRAMSHNLDFPEYKSLKHTDIYFWVRSKMKLHSNRLQNACDFLNIPSKNHAMHGRMWTKALAGDKKCLDYIFVHNKEDVESTEALFKRLLPFTRMIDSTI